MTTTQSIPNFKKSGRSISYLLTYYTAIIKWIRRSGIPDFLIPTKFIVVTILELEIASDSDRIPYCTYVLYTGIPGFVYLSYMDANIRQEVK